MVLKIKLVAMQEIKLPCRKQADAVMEQTVAILGGCFLLSNNWLLVVCQDGTA